MALNPDTWTLKTTEAIEAALADARERSNPEVTPDHLLVSLLSQEEGVILPLFDKIGVPSGSLRSRAVDAVERLPRAVGGETRMGKELSLVFDSADKIRAELGDDYLSTEHLLLALVDADQGSAEPRLPGVTRAEVL